MTTLVSSVNASDIISLDSLMLGILSASWNFDVVVVHLLLTSSVVIPTFLPLFAILLGITSLRLLSLITSVLSCIARYNPSSLLFTGISRSDLRYSWPMMSAIRSIGRLGYCRR